MGILNRNVSSIIVYVTLLSFVEGCVAVSCVVLKAFLNVFVVSIPCFSVLEKAYIITGEKHFMKTCVNIVFFRDANSNSVYANFVVTERSVIPYQFTVCGLI